jgi:hypothetical protein
MSLVSNGSTSPGLPANQKSVSNRSILEKIQTSSRKSSKLVSPLSLNLDLVNMACGETVKTPVDTLPVATQKSHEQTAKLEETDRHS